MGKIPGLYTVILLTVALLCSVYWHVNSNANSKQRLNEISESLKGLETEIYRQMEQSYFEGQRDALNGDWRIKKVDSNCYVWTKTCWDDSNRKLLYVPICDSIQYKK